MKERISNPDNPIAILSGEGENGTWKLYAGKRTDRAIKLRVAKEACGGDRWVKVVVYSHISKYDEPVGIDYHTGETCHFPAKFAPAQAKNQRTEKNEIH